MQESSEMSNSERRLAFGAYIPSYQRKINVCRNDRTMNKGIGLVGPVTVGR